MEPPFPGHPVTIPTELSRVPHIGIVTCVVTRTSLNKQKLINSLVFGISTAICYMLKRSRGQLFIRIPHK
jgi:hypothetical protein